MIFRLKSFFTLFVVFSPPSPHSSSFLYPSCFLCETLFQYIASTCVSLDTHLDMVTFFLRFFISSRIIDWVYGKNFFFLFLFSILFSCSFINLRGESLLIALKNKIKYFFFFTWKYLGNIPYRFLLKKWV